MYLYIIFIYITIYIIMSETDLTFSFFLLNLSGFDIIMLDV